MELSKRHYEMFARWIAAMGRGVDRHGDYVLRGTFPQWAESIADELEAGNPSFDRVRFLRACDVITGEKE